MKTRTILDGNAFYEIDEECLAQKKEIEKKQKQAKETGKRGENRKKANQQ